MKSHFRSEAPRHLPKLVALVLALALSACSGAVQTQSGSSKSKESFPWVTPTSINVGVLSPLTGPLAVQGIPQTNGNKAFFAYVNEKFKGVYGRRIDMVAVDSQFNQQVAVQSFPSLVAQSAMLTQVFGTPITQALKPLVDSEQILGQPASYGVAFYSDPFLTMFGAPYPIQIENLIDWARTNGHAGNGKWAILYRDDALGKDQLAGFDFATQYYKIPDVLRVPYEPNATDFTAQVQQLKQFGAGDVILAATADVAPRVVVGSARLGYNPIWLGSTPIWNPVLSKNTEFMQAISKNNYFVASPLPSFASSNKGIVTAREHLKTYTPDQGPDPYFSAGWLEGYWTWKVLQQASKDKDFSRQGLINAQEKLGSTDFDGLLLAPVDFSKPPVDRVSRAMEIDRVDLSQPGGLAQITNFSGESATAYKIPTS